MCLESTIRKWLLKFRVDVGGMMGAKFPTLQPLDSYVCWWTSPFVIWGFPKMGVSPSHHEMGFPWFPNSMGIPGSWNSNWPMVMTWMMVPLAAAQAPLASSWRHGLHARLRALHRFAAAPRRHIPGKPRERSAMNQQGWWYHGDMNIYI